MNTAVSILPSLDIFFLLLFMAGAVFIIIMTYGYTTRRALEIYAEIPMIKNKKP